MWTATRDLSHGDKFRVAAGMPIPRQSHRSLLRQVRGLFGEDCMEWKPDVAQTAVDKVNLENSLLRRENTKLKAKLGQGISKVEDPAPVNSNIQKENEILKASCEKLVKSLEAAEKEGMTMLETNEKQAAEISSLKSQLAEANRKRK